MPRALQGRLLGMGIELVRRNAECLSVFFSHA